MANITTLIGALLTFMGPIFYLGSPPDHRSITALIPTFFGIPLTLLGLAARDEKKRKHATHGALALALLGLLGSLMRAGRWSVAFAGQAPAPRLAAIEQIVMALLCLVLLVLGVRSFIAARRA